MERPASVFLSDFVRKQKSCTGNLRARTYAHSGAVEVFRITQEPQSRAGGKPTVCVIFRISVAGYYLLSVGEGFVDFGYEIFGKNIVSIKHNKCVEIILSEILGNL